MRDEPRSGCPINGSVEALGDRWSLIVLRDMIFGGRRHFRDLLAGSMEGIASNILSSRLKALVAKGLLTHEEAGRGRRGTYSLTEAGIQTVPIMVALGSWGLRHLPATPELAVRARLLEEGGPPLWEDLMDELREAHLGIPRPDPARPRASRLLQEAYERVLAEGQPDPPALRRGRGSLKGLIDIADDGDPEAGADLARDFGLMS
ncbi:helix-turn-helix transcriptional regulator [Microbispora sp. NBC_01189]|uniref:winged helix-turn-helix transcriptional regulator n=1 Tax=Microbispora sp. NBC_01189 TaxID=2903583 RepID=UPI002E14A940|nr:helix-turn-helix transcriptional regulator [Microbispora sp. NBC_01189]